MPKQSSGPPKEHKYGHDTVLDGRMLVSPDGQAVYYREQYESYYTEGWETRLEFETAIELIEELGLLPSDGQYDIVVEADGAWIISCEEGSYYCATDPSGIRVAGVMSFDDGLTDGSITAWRDSTALETRT